MAKVAYLCEMLGKTFIEKELQRVFTGQEYFTIGELLAFYQQYDPDLKEGTLAWRIFDLKKRHVIKNAGKGIYSLEEKSVFKPVPDEFMQKLAEHLSGSLDHYFYNLWSTAWLNEWTELQATSFLYILEVDKGSMEQVFFNLKDMGTAGQLFLKPDEKTIANYISELPVATVIAPMISRAPVLKVKNIMCPTLEKILVDLYCDEKVFYAFQGQQLVTIFEAAMDRYIINFSRLLNYARRRNREEGLKQFLEENTTLSEKLKKMIE